MASSRIASAQAYLPIESRLLLGERSLAFLEGFFLTSGLLEGALSSACRLLSSLKHPSEQVLRFIHETCSNVTPHAARRRSTLLTPPLAPEFLRPISFRHSGSWRLLPITSRPRRDVWDA
jgi:hypothetical protein